MSQIENQVNTLILGFFSRINANVTEKNGLFDVTIPEEYSKMFGTNKLKITFESELSDSFDYELISPGSNLLLKIMNKCLDFGPVAIGKLSSNPSNLKIIRFYFFVLFESIKTETKLIFVDVDINSKKKITLDNTEISFDDVSDMEIDSETVDDCYVESITFLEHNALKSKIHDFKNEISLLQKEDLENVIVEYKKRKSDLHEKFTILRSKGVTGTKLDNLMSENETIGEEEKILIKNIEKKYAINVDFALFTSLILT